MAVRIFGTHDEKTIQQLETCVAAEEGAVGVLCADGHLGYSMPIGGVVAYRDHISPSGVGFDIGCGPAEAGGIVPGLGYRETPTLAKLVDRIMAAP